jgi:hypothetical protein
VVGVVVTLVVVGRVVVVASVVDVVTVVVVGRTVVTFDPQEQDTDVTMAYP